MSMVNGDKLCSIGNRDEAVSRVARYVKVRELVRLSNPRQEFNVWLQVGGREGQTVFLEGEPVDLSIRSEHDAYVLMVNVDPQGYVNTITAQVKKGESLELKVGRVEPPLGTEYLKLFAFQSRVPGLERFTSTATTSVKILDPAEGEVVESLGLIQTEAGWAEATREVMTVRPPKL